MAYLGKTPSQAVRSRYYFTASGGETSLSGADDNSNVLTFTDGNYVDVSLNGVALVAGTDYNTTTANTIGGLTALVASDVVEVIVYDTFSVFGGNMAANLNFKDNVKANFGTGNDLQIYHDASNSIINDAGTGNLQLQLGGSTKLEVQSTGVDVTGRVQADSLQVDNSSGPYMYFTASGTGVTDFLMRESSGNNYIMNWTDGADVTFYTGVGSTVGMKWDASAESLGIGTTSPSQLLHVNTTSASSARIRVQNSEGYAEIATDGTDGFLTAGGTEILRFESGGNVGIGTSSPDQALNVYSTYYPTIKVETDTSTTGFPIVQLADGRTGGSTFQIESGRTLGEFSLRDATSGSERMRIDSTGNVGIGTSSPGFPLQVQTDTTTNVAMFDFVGAATVGGVTNAGSSAELRLAGLPLTFTGSGGAGGEHMRINSSGNVGIGTSSPASGAIVRFLEIEDATSAGIVFDAARVFSIYSSTSSTLAFRDETAGSNRMLINSAGDLLIAKSTGDLDLVGHEFDSSGYAFHTRDGANVLYINRKTSDGGLVSFYQDGTSEGTITVSGTTVSYNGGHLARWSQLTDGTKDTNIVKGTVMTNLDQMAVWHHEAVAATYYVEGDELPEITPATYYTEEDTLPEGVSVGDEKTAAVYAQVGDEKTPAADAYTEDNEQLNCMAVSSVEGDPNVAGVFVNWDNDDDEFNDMNIAMTGDMVIRIAQGTTVARGDLLMSAGDGTAKPQGDDIVRSKTIAKVTSTHVSHTYDDGSYLVPCVLMAC